MMIMTDRKMIFNSHFGVIRTPFWCHDDFLLRLGFHFNFKLWLMEASVLIHLNSQKNFQEVTL